MDGDIDANFDFCFASVDSTLNGQVKGDVSSDFPHLARWLSSSSCPAAVTRLDPAAIFGWWCKHSTVHGGVRVSRSNSSNSPESHCSYARHTLVPHTKIDASCESSTEYNWTTAAATAAAATAKRRKGLTGHLVPTLDPFFFLPLSLLIGASHPPLLPVEFSFILFFPYSSSFFFCCSSITTFLGS